MANQLPVSRVVSSTVNLSPSGAQSQSLSDLLLLGTSGIIDPVERMRTYGSLAAVSADFGTTAEEYKAAAVWFGQVPQPTRLKIGRWVNASSKGGLRCAPLSSAQQALANFTAITTGALKIAKDGGAAADVTGINLSGAANLNAVAALLQTAIAGTTVVWNATLSRFEIQSTTVGASSAISFLQAPSTGVDITGLLLGRATDSGAYTYAGQVAETAVAAVAAFDNQFGQQWYGLVIPSAVDADHQAVGAYIEGATTKHYYGVNTQTAGVLVAATTTDIAYVMKGLGYKRSCVQYSSSSAYAVVSLLARILTVDYSSVASVITLKFKVEPGIVAEQLSMSQADAAEGKNANLFVAYDNATNILEQGMSVDGTFIDVVLGTDWLALAIQTAIYNLLYTTPTKIPQTDAGTQLLVTAAEGVLAQGVLNGLLAPGTWNSDGFGTLKQGDYLQKGYYVYVGPVGSQLQADRLARKAPPLKIAAKLAGAIHSSSILINVNQ